MLRDYQQQFAKQVQSAGHGMLPLARPGEADRAALALRVYRNNSMHARVQAVMDTYPALQALLGVDALRTLAIGYCRATPQTDALLQDYPAGFPDFLARGVAAVPAPPALVVALARLELAWFQVGHAAEAEPANADMIRRCTPEAAAIMQLALHPAGQCLMLPEGLLEMFDRLCADAPFRLPDAAAPRVAVLLVRPHAEVRAIALTPVQDALVRAIQAELPLGQALSGTDLDRALPEFLKLLDSGAFVAAGDLNQGQIPCS